MTRAWLLGLWECRSDFGRTHPTDQDWNEAYDRGRAFGRFLWRTP